MRYRFILLSILFVLIVPKSYSQDHLPYIAVISFSAINVSESDAEVITGLFETALVNTGVYRVIEQTQMHEILKVQEFSLSDCTSEECAVEIGQLLSAEQIILGTLASIGGKYILTAKFVDVAKGVSLKADKVESPSLADMTDGAEVLAYKLAGLSYRREAAPRAVGTITYSIPTQAKAEIKSESYIKVFQGEGSLEHVGAGEYTVEITSDIYEPYTTTLAVTQGKTVAISPTLHHTKEYECQQFSRKLEEIENQILGISDISQEDIDRLISVMQKIYTARHQHPELVARSELLLSWAEKKLTHQGIRVQLNALSQRQNTIESRLNRMEPSRKVRNLGKWVSLGAGVVSLGTSVVFYFMADKAYDEYLDATITSEVIHYRDRFRAFQTGMYIGIGVGGAGLGSSLTLWFTQRREKKYESELAEVETRIRDLQEDLK